MILFVGDKPGKKNVSDEVAFVGTKSYKTLLEWIWRMDLNINHVELANQHMLMRESENNKTKELICSDGRYWYPDNVTIVALGNKASETLADLEMEHFKLPHPSGLNRKINNKKYLDKVLKECKTYLNRR